MEVAAALELRVGEFECTVALGGALTDGYALRLAPDAVASLLRVDVGVRLWHRVALALCCTVCELVADMDCAAVMLGVDSIDRESVTEEVVVALLHGDAEALDDDDESREGDAIALSDCVPQPDADAETLRDGVPL